MILQQFIDEIYITEDDLLYGKIIDMGADNYWIVWEDDEVKIPEHGLDNAIRYVKKHYNEHRPI